VRDAIDADGFHAFRLKINADRARGI
jgi:hypothetical protein